MNVNRKRLPKAPSLWMLLCLVFSMAVMTGFTGIPAAAFEPPHSGGEIEADTLASFADELITRQLDEYPIAGAVVSIVSNGKVELVRGYGVADVAAQTPVTPDETIVRIGSTSKLFTWTAVMQLAEQGKIDLHADVNTYLPDFQIPDTFAEPVTLLNLLSHNAGFEERTAGTKAASPEGMIPLHDYLVAYMPDRVRPAGELITYSNYGAALAGYIVETVSGMPFEQYIEINIFKPLGMTHSTFRQPLPAELEGRLAKSYSYSGQFVPGQFEYPNLAPAATMSTTAADMANFMIAHLQEGRVEDTRVLEPETVRQMQTRLFSNDERLDGVAYGWMEWTYNGQRVLWHSGDIGNWHSGLAIIPEQGLGFFVTYNSNAGSAAVNEFYYDFMETFFPVQKSAAALPTDAPALDLQGLAGEYRSTRSVYHHVERIIHFPGNGNVNVTASADCTLSLAGLTLYPKAPNVFVTQDGTDTFIFRMDDSGEVAYLLVNSNLLWSYEPVSWYETAAFHLLVFGVCFSLLLTVPLAAVIGLLRGRKRSKDNARLPRIARTWTFLLAVAFLLVLVPVITYTSGDYNLPFPLYLGVTLAIILAACILVIGPVIFTVLAWVRRYWNPAGRIHFTLVTVALIGTVWLMDYWNLLGFRY